MCLAHVVGGVEGAYVRTDLCERRRSINDRLGGRCPAWIDAPSALSWNVTLFCDVPFFCYRVGVTPCRQAKLRIGGPGSGLSRKRLVACDHAYVVYDAAWQ